MYCISDISAHRDEKIRSLLENHVDFYLNRLLTKLRNSDTKIDLPTIEQAIQFSLAQDYGTAELNKYYVTHPIRVTEYMLDWMILRNKFSTEALVATVIHNAFEKNILTYEEVQTSYGNWCAETIRILTQDREAMKIETKRDKYYESVYSLDVMGQLIKLLDKMDNLLAISISPSEETRQNYILEIENKILPIAKKYYPELLTYLETLINVMNRAGYYRPGQS